MDVRIEHIAIESPTAAVMGRSGERAGGKATVLVSVKEHRHEFKLTFQSREFTTLDGLAEDVRKEVERIGKLLAEVAANPLL